MLPSTACDNQPYITNTQSVTQGTSMGDGSVNIANFPVLRLLTFFQQWLRHPRRMASAVPSGRQLANLMAAALPSSNGKVVELGAGTGAITDALVRHGIAPGSLLVVEMNAVLHRLLQKRFPQVQVACADARHLESLVEACRMFDENEVDVVCSSLGLLTMPKDLQHDIVAAAFKVLRPDGVFVQYTYGPHHPLDDDVCNSLGLTYQRAGLAWRNLPPARVYVYSRQVAA